jgi:hypothetical protein
MCALLQGTRDTHILPLVLVGLYEESEKPENPLDFIKQFLGGPADVDEVVKNEELKRKVIELSEKVDSLTKQRK